MKVVINKRYGGFGLYDATRKETTIRAIETHQRYTDRSW